MYVFGQAGDIVQTIANSSQWGIAGGLLIMAFWFVKYIRDAQTENRAERKDMSDSYQKVISDVASKIETMGTKLETMGSSLIAGFATQMAEQRLESRAQVKEIGQIVHDLREMASTAVGSREYAEQLRQKLEAKK